jgi:hypothetical protein
MSRRTEHRTLTDTHHPGCQLTTIIGNQYLHEWTMGLGINLTPILHVIKGSPMTLPVAQDLEHNGAGSVGQWMDAQEEWEQSCVAARSDPKELCCYSRHDHTAIGVVDKEPSLWMKYWTAVASNDDWEIEYVIHRTLSKSIDPKTKKPKIKSTEKTAKVRSRTLGGAIRLAAADPRANLAFAAMPVDERKSRSTEVTYDDWTTAVIDDDDDEIFFESKAPFKDSLAAFTTSLDVASEKQLIVEMKLAPTTLDDDEILFDSRPPVVDLMVALEASLATAKAKRLQTPVPPAPFTLDDDEEL